MLLELFTALTTTDCPPWARSMGYLGEAIAIQARHKRCRADWAPHLEQTRRAVLKAMARCKRKRTILVAGSGLCLDLPLAELAATFENVLLLDVVHLRAARRHGFGNVEHETVDVTGVAWALHADPKSIPEVPAQTLHHDREDIDLVVSLNIASQLPVTPSVWLSRRGDHDEAAIDNLKHDLVWRHLEWLRGFDAPALLICDREWQMLDPTGRVTGSEDPMHQLPLPETLEEWFWNVAPLHETGAGYARRNRVGVSEFPGRES